MRPRLFKKNLFLNDNKLNYGHFIMSSDVTEAHQRFTLKPSKKSGLKTASQNDRYPEMAWVKKSGVHDWFAKKSRHSQITQKRDCDMLSIQLKFCETLIFERPLVHPSNSMPHSTAVQVWNSGD